VPYSLTGVLFLDVVLRVYLEEGFTWPWHTLLELPACDPKLQPWEIEPKEEILFPVCHSQFLSPD